MQFSRSISTSLAPYANSVDGTTDAKARRVRGGQPGARVGAGRREQKRSAVVEPDGDNEGVRDGARGSCQCAVDSGRTHATLASSPRHQHGAGTLLGQRRRHHRGGGQEGSRGGSQAFEWAPDAASRSVLPSTNPTVTTRVCEMARNVTSRRSSTPEKDATTSTGNDDKSTRAVSATTAKAAHLTKESPPTQAFSVGSACTAHDAPGGHRFPQHAALDAVAVVRGRGSTLARVLHEVKQT